MRWRFKHLNVTVPLLANGLPCVHVSINHISAIKLDQYCQSCSTHSTGKFKSDIETGLEIPCKVKELADTNKSTLYLVPGYLGITENETVDEKIIGMKQNGSNVENTGRIYPGTATGVNLIPTEEWVPVSQGRENSRYISKSRLNR